MDSICICTYLMINDFYFFLLKICLISVYFFKNLSVKENKSLAMQNVYRKKNIDKF